MQTGFTPNSHLGTPVDVVQLSASGKAYEGSFAQKIYKASLDGVESFDEREAAYPRFRPTLVGPTLTNPPTGNTTGQTGIILNPFDPEDSQVRPPDYTTFLQPGKPLREEIHGPDGPNWTTSGPISVSRTPTGKFRSEHGASTVARAEQEAASGRRRRQQQLTAMFANDGAPYIRQPVQLGSSGGTSYPPVNASGAQQQAMRLVPVDVPKPVPTWKQFLNQLGKLLSNQLNDQEKQQFAIENALNITILVLAISALLLLIAVIIVACVKTSPKTPKPKIETNVEKEMFGGGRRFNRLTTLSAE